MAINYSTLFQQLGALVAQANTYRTLASTTLVSGLQGIVTAYGTTGTTYGTSNSPILNINSDYESFQRQVASFRRTINGYITRTLTNKDTVVSQLPITSGDISTVMPALIEDMYITPQSVKGCAVSLGSVTAGSANVGNGTALIDKTLDGLSSPATGVAPHIRYNGVLSEFGVPSETMTLICVADSSSNSVPEGGEGWSWFGGANYGLFNYRAEGSGEGPGISTANSGASVCANLGFESFSGNSPSQWTIDYGTSGTNVFAETSTVHGYGTALKLTGDGSTTVIQLSQSARSKSLLARRRYCVTVRACRGGSAPGGGSFDVYFTGTGYTAGSTEKISMGTGGLGGSYTLYSFYLNAPTYVPTDMKLVIRCNGTLASGANVYIDSMSVTPCVYHGGVNATIVRGSTPWSKGDRLTFTVSNDQGGNYNNLLRQTLKVQLPSKTDGSQTLSDSWAS